MLNKEDILLIKKYKKQNIDIFLCKKCNKYFTIWNNKICTICSKRNKIHGGF